MATKDKLTIRNSTAEFLIFTADNRQDAIEVRFESETIWLTQKLIAKLFDVSIPTINEHLKNIFETTELIEKSVIRNFLTTASDGKKYEVNHYNLQAIIAVGFKVNSQRAVEFRKWANKVLDSFAIKGYVLDKERLQNGNLLGKDYYDRLLEEIREIRLSERKFYQKITDIYSTSLDYDSNNKITKEFFAKVQNKLHFAIHKHTAPELIKNRANSTKQNMGLTSWAKSPEGKILKSDVIVAKNYLSESELKSLGRIVNAYLDLAEERASRNIPMTMKDWSDRLDKFLEFDEREILNDGGKISAKIAKEFAETEWEKYRVTQDKLFESDFDKLTKESLNE
ncbi:MAG: virulence RhuM family protein [bacterium]